MKTKFSNKELAHVFMSGRQSEGSGSNMSFRDNIAYSYGNGYAIAQIFRREGIVLVNSRTYSNSTAKHINHVWRAISDEFKVLHVPYVGEMDELAHISNIKHFCEGIKDTADKLKRVNKYASVEFYEREMNVTKENLSLYVRTWGRTKKADIKRMISEALKTVSPVTFERGEELKRRNAEADERARIKDEKRKAERRIELAEEVAKWLAGQNINVGWDYPDTLLRVKGKEVQTSRGATVSYQSAKRLYLRWRECRECIKGESINGYEVRDADADTITIGCHELSAQEVNRLALSEGW